LTNQGRKVREDIATRKLIYSYSLKDATKSIRNRLHGLENSKPRTRKLLGFTGLGLTLSGTVAGGLVGQADASVSEVVGALDVMSESRNFHEAIRGLDEGDLAYAQQRLIGPENSVYDDLVDKGHARAALAFKIYMDEVFESTRPGTPYSP
jgi:hypothetical protein